MSIDEAQYLRLFDFGLMYSQYHVLSTVEQARIWYSVAIHAHYSKMEIRLQFGGVTDLRYPVLCVSQSNGQHHSLVYVEQADLW